jgi:hypothetical protein
MDAEIGLKPVEHLLGVFTAARLRLESAPGRCDECGSYAVGGGVCHHCGWEDPHYEPVEPEPISEQEWERPLAEPCIPSSDISTFIRPDDVV